MQISLKSGSWLLHFSGKELYLIADYSFNHFNRKLFDTTLTLLNAIAAPAIIGFNKKPVKGYNIPAATGIPIKL